MAVSSFAGSVPPQTNGPKLVGLPQRLSAATAPYSGAMSKLYARDRAQLVVAAYESGLVVPGA